MTALYVFRHPETTWNVAERYQGRLESPLSQQGQVQARLVARTFAGSSLDAVYSSPLQRALFLARELARATDAPLRIDQRLTEMAQGPWEGLLLRDIKLRFQDLYRDWYLRPDCVCFPGGEDLEAVRQRSLSAVADLYATFPDGHVAVVTHSVVVQTLVASGLSIDLRHIHSIHVANAGMTTLCGLEPPGLVLALNVTSPLYPSPVTGAAAQGCVSWKPRRVSA
jgi:probable phosphoglycerate mutase